MVKQGMISIIVPVYNVSEYIGKCLDSLLSQTYQNLEIICIDDGSTDNGKEILEEYAKGDSRIKIICQANAGVSNARNKGLEILHGEYFAFVDPDDYVECDMYECLVEAINKDGADIACCSYYYETDGLRSSVENKRKVKKGTIDTKDFLKYVYMRDSYKAVGGYVVTRLFRTQTFRKEEWVVRFDEDIFYGEGTLFLAKCMMQAKKMIYIDQALYVYKQRESSAMHNKRRMVKCMGSLPAYEKIIYILKASKVHRKIVKYVKRFYVYHASVLLKEAEKCNIHTFDDKIKNEIRRYLWQYIVTNIKYPKRIIGVLEQICK